VNDTRTHRVVKFILLVTHVRSSFSIGSR
jgi:hypothetical protein